MRDNAMPSVHHQSTQGADNSMKADPLPNFLHRFLGGTRAATTMEYTMVVGFVAVAAVAAVAGFQGQIGDSMAVFTDRAVTAIQDVAAR